MPAIERLMLDGQPEPVSHYCHVTKAGNLVWVSGTVGVAADGSIPAGVVEQFELAIANMDACLKAVGAGAEHVVKVTVYLTDVSDRKKINPIRQRYFGPHRPASTLVEVSALVLPELMVEIEAQAVLP
ncbi:MAG: 2-iminobutanoate/2-iminopropanoate deaminase [Acetobacteraceae bacterium]|jgi:enamine deaminase RidA (YjgF/YER057c/UK114 family)|nr:2-iminobutanoate/2-iminopropanoate deaminase [Acetobacteraceae bacterium]